MFGRDGEDDQGPYALHLSIHDGRLVFDIRDGDDAPLIAIGLALGPFRRLVKDYQMLVDSHIKAVEEGREARIQAIDMGRRGLHNEGAELMTAAAGRQDRHRFRHRAAAVHPGLRAARNGCRRDEDRRRARIARVWVDPDDGWSVHIFDQTKLPWSLEILRLTTRDQAAHAIRAMQARGAPLIGAVAAYGLCLALRADASTEAMERDAALLAETRPDRDQSALGAGPDADPAAQHARPGERVAAAYAEAAAIADEDAAQNEAIGRHGLPLIEAAARTQGVGSTC